MVYKKDIKFLNNLNFLIIDCLQINSHPGHFNLESALKLANTCKAKKTILTNLHVNLDYGKLKKILPPNIIPAFDGINFSF